MEITLGCVHFQIFLQRLCNLPVYLVVLNGELQLRQACLTSTNSHASKFWYLSKFILVYAMTSSAFRIALLFSKWKDGSNVEQLCISTFISTLCCIALSVFQSLQQHGQDLITAEIKCSKLAGFKLNPRPSFRKVSRMKETLVYVVVGGLLLGLALGALMTPFLLNYLFVQFTLNFLIGQIQYTTRFH